LVVSLLGTKAWYSSRCALIWKPQVTPSNRLLFRLSPSTLRTDETASGLLLTPSVVQTEEEPEKMVARRTRNGYKNGTKWGSLASQVKFGMLTTPSSRDWKDTATPIKDRKDGKSRIDQASRQVGAVTGLRLQPNFAAWMMGYPQNWADLNYPSHNIVKNNSKPTETPSSRK
jgi:hypothetical protein